MNRISFTICVCFAALLGCDSGPSENPPSGISSKESSLPSTSGQQPQTETQEEHQDSAHKPLLNPDGTPKYTNTLINETSPYLLQHAHNPVQWYPWGDAALQKAKDENKLIFLSVGYSSCHWCHVMEHESFMDEEIAKYMNEHFVCIKVDREERPDVDTIYMESLHVFNQLTKNGRGGGWPLSVFMLPDSKPFFGGTYIPARVGDRGSNVGFETLLQKVQEVWQETPDKLVVDAGRLTEYTQKSLYDAEVKTEKVIKPSWITSAGTKLQQQFDPDWGGFNYNPANDQVPKFPNESKLLWLASLASSGEASDSVKNMMITTADRIMMGGIHDHVGGGFHRYSVDRYWRIPHYEKMLYNNGQLCSFYSELYQITGNTDYKKTVDDMLGFVEREMLSPDGGYYAALDADSEGEEGKFYVWDREEIQKLLSDEEYQLYAKVFGIDGLPNFEGKHYTPVLSGTWAQTAERVGMSKEDLWKALKPINQKLFDYRAKRIRPGTDTKVLTSWNGLMIRGLADAGRIFENAEYIERAENAARFALSELRQDGGKLFRTYTAGEAKLNAYLDDYSFLIDGFIALHRATDNKDWLSVADELQLKQNELFLDADLGGYFFTSSDHQKLLARTKDPVDSAIPSGNGVAASNLIYLSKRLKKPEYIELAKGITHSTFVLLQRAPQAATRLLESIPELVE